MTIELFERVARRELTPVVVGFAVSSDVMTMARGEWSRIQATPARGVLRWCGLPVRLDMDLPPRTVIAEYDEP